MIQIKKIINANNYKKYLFLDLTLIVLCLFTLVSYVSYAAYNDGFSLRFINARVGNFLTKDSDLSITIYAEEVSSNGTGTNTYKIVSDIPQMGYTFKETSCKNGSTIIYDDTTKLIKATVTKKDVCSAYFDLSKEADVLINVMIEETLNSKTYIKSSKIPIYGYNYNYATCENGSNITYDETSNSIYVTSTGKDICNVYFDINKENIKANVYLNRNGTLELLTEIDKSKNYKVNDESECRLNYKIVNSEITCLEGKININTEPNAKCDVILDEVTNE